MEITNSDILTVLFLALGGFILICFFCIVFYLMRVIPLYNTLKKQNNNMKSLMLIPIVNVFTVFKLANVVIWPMFLLMFLLLVKPLRFMALLMLFVYLFSTYLRFFIRFNVGTIASISSLFSWTLTFLFFFSFTKESMFVLLITLVFVIITTIKKPMNNNFNDYNNYNN